MCLGFYGHRGCVCNCWMIALLTSNPPLSTISRTTLALCTSSMSVFIPTSSSRTISSSAGSHSSPLLSFSSFCSSGCSKISNRVPLAGFDKNEQHWNGESSHNCHFCRPPTSDNAFKAGSIFNSRLISLHSFQVLQCHHVVVSRSSFPISQRAWRKKNMWMELITLTGECRHSKLARKFSVLWALVEN